MLIIDSTWPIFFRAAMSMHQHQFIIKNTKKGLRCNVDQWVHYMFYCWICTASTCHDKFSNFPHLGTVGPFALIWLIFRHLDKIWTYFIIFVTLLYFFNTFFGLFLAIFRSFWAILEPFFDLFHFFKLPKIARKMSEINAKWPIVLGP